MGKRIVVGSVINRHVAEMMEQLLRNRGVPAFSEMGRIMSAYTDCTPSRIYVDEEYLTPEAAAIIKEALGKEAYTEVLDSYISGGEGTPSDTQAG